MPDFKAEIRARIAEFGLPPVREAQCGRRCQLYHPDRRREHVPFAVHREPDRHRIAIQQQHAADKDHVVARSRERRFW